MSIRTALNTLPGKPGLVMAVIVMIVVLSFYYLDLYRLCNDMTSLRTHFYLGVQKSNHKQLNLAEIIPFEWDRVRVILNFQNKGKLLDCPFNWDWTQEQRKQLMKKKRLNVIAFARENTNTIIDFDAEKVNFELIETVFTPLSARFHVNSQNSDKTQYLLSQIR